MPWGWKHRRRDARWLDGTVVGGAAGTYAAILEHPFLAGLTDGRLDPDAFAHYLVQDVYYLHDFARALTVVGSKAPTHAGVGMFARHAASTAEVELALHESLLPELGIQNADAMPVTRNLTGRFAARSAAPSSPMLAALKEPWYRTPRC